jgi:hypothetical protein
MKRRINIRVIDVANYFVYVVVELLRACISLLVASY